MFYVTLFLSKKKKSIFFRGYQFFKKLKKIEKMKEKRVKNGSIYWLKVCIYIIKLKAYSVKIRHIIMKYGIFYMSFFYKLVKN